MSKVAVVLGIIFLVFVAVLIFSLLSPKAKPKSNSTGTTSTGTQSSSPLWKLNNVCVRCADNGIIYRIQNGHARWYGSTEAHVADGSPIVMNADCNHISQLPPEGEMPFPIRSKEEFLRTFDGRCFRAENNGTMHKVKNNQIRWFGSTEQYVQDGSPPCAIIPTASASIIPAGVGAMPWPQSTKEEVLTWYNGHCVRGVSDSLMLKIKDGRVRWFGGGGDYERDGSPPCAILSNAAIATISERDGPMPFP